MKNDSNFTDEEIEDARKASERLSKLNPTPPQRRADGRDLPFIPPEVYLEIFEHLPVVVPITFDWLDEDVSQTDLKRVYDNLIPVCHYFRAVCLPRRLEHLKIGFCERDLVSFIDGITAFPYPAWGLRALIQRVSLQSPSLADLGVLPLIFISGFHSFPNLSTILVQNIPVNSEMLASVALHPRIDSVSFIHCLFMPLQAGTDDLLFDCARDKLLQISSPPTPWIALSALGCGGDDDVGLYFDALARLAASPHLTSLRTDRFDLARAVFSETTHFGSLTDLSILLQTDEDALSLETYLSRTPSLETLRIIDYRGSSHASFSRLHPEALPRLSCIECPLIFLDGLVRGRPLTEVHLAMGGSLKVDVSFDSIDSHISDGWYRPLSHLAQSTACLKELSINVKVLERFLIPAIAQATALKKLNLYWDKSTIDDLRRALRQDQKTSVPVHTSVQTIHIPSRALVPSCPYDFQEHALNLVLQHDLIRSVFQTAFPAATEIAFCAQVAWRRGEEAGVWCPVVLKPESTIRVLLRRTNVTAAMYRHMWDEHPLEYPSAVVDWEGCFSNLFGDKAWTALGLYGGLKRVLLPEQV
ncbi:hypothetical protein K488DRAFT_88743 [Vararia minispora EC-137]|uniref:Uncharacterized protein n=1 Tax=Vararia minispora EC-137 TaxID=1314806 RepID=A0ACB8QCD6_9AGAM|nr:hypothetical protein K488DRAFT_88743 [Vararia minispora EC-137]